MTDIELNIVLREMARSAGLCDPWYEEWKDDSTIDECIDRYVRGFDFAVEKDYPPLDFIRKNFRKEDLHRHHIFLDEEVSIGNAESGIWIFLGDCVGSICFRGFSVGTVYIRHNTNIKIVSEDMAKVFMSQYDDACAETVPIDMSTIRRYDRRK